ncbi:sigma-70 family RNA polymerase sigma factor [Dactylosporangium sp. NPDC051485]|uniref:RNA polymerase sigma factor n=1 Tax=Dactylosporangium sp. NPDC051485 TaxID=3154846 RepID=UPI003445ECEC
MSVDEGYERFYRSAMPRVFVHARFITGNEEEAWDLVQEAMTVLLERWPERRAAGLDANVGYACGIARNLALSARRRFAAQLRALVRLRARPCIPWADSFDHVELMRDLAEPLRHLSRQQRAVLLLSADGMETAEVARVLGIDASTVRSHKQALRRRIPRAAIGPVTREGGGA